MNFKDLSTLQIALGVSVVVHAALLTVRFVDPESFNKVFSDTPLEVILVNTRTNDRPDPAARLRAQTSLAGGGDLDKGRATSPLPPSSFTTVGDSFEDAQRKVDAMQAEQMQMLTQLKRDLAAMPAPDPRNAGDPAEAKAQEEKRRQMINLLAEIERRVNEENARPKKRYLSPFTREAAFATYVDSLRRRVEAQGTANFPTLAGKKLYGELTMTITVNFDGRLLSTVIDESSGQAVLDKRAQAIVASVGNFGTFTDAMRKEHADQIVIRPHFRFSHDGSVELSSQ
ncbi:energy transducer TonB [Variovorax guangxiensis]|uniref:Energy transducer TonB n=1 Tax=Variovorax guangxiensis TaxID=1775474 RepID=A0A433MGR2_9BURK|nr:TonB C-terminal domain-containing protein [Variovorax guangxiensis]RUR67219.1 energy transducer TonB [Variovorax guangxiensis]